MIMRGRIEQICVTCGRPYMKVISGGNCRRVRGVRGSNTINCSKECSRKYNIQGTNKRRRIKLKNDR